MVGVYIHITMCFSAKEPCSSTIISICSFFFCLSGRNNDFQKPDLDSQDPFLSFFNDFDF